MQLWCLSTFFLQMYGRSLNESHTFHKFFPIRTKKECYRLCKLNYFQSNFWMLIYTGLLRKSIFLSGSNLVSLPRSEHRMNRTQLRTLLLIIISSSRRSISGWWFYINLEKYIPFQSPPSSSTWTTHLCKSRPFLTFCHQPSNKFRFTLTALLV